MRSLIHKLLTETEVPPPGMVRVDYNDGEVRYMTPLAASCTENERRRQNERRHGKGKRGPERKKRCKHGHPMTGKKANVREYYYGGFTHRCCYQCVLDRKEQLKAQARIQPKTLHAAKARKAAA